MKIQGLVLQNNKCWERLSNHREGFHWKSGNIGDIKKKKKKNMIMGFYSSFWLNYQIEMCEGFEESRARV